MKELLDILPDVKERTPLIISGPCSAETREQLLAAAEQISACGVKVLRAGIWKPRTRPGGFEGVGAPGLEWLAEAGRLYGMKTATEVANKAHVEAAVAAGIDVLWIGARTSANPFAVQEVADTLDKVADKDTTILVKNPVNADLNLWIGALQRIYNAGFHRLGAIHRGFTAYGNSTYRNQPQWHIPIDLRLRYPNLPLICDPSHIGGRRDLIAPLSQEAMNMGFDGLMIESHCHPEEAWSDAAQQITPAALRKLLDALVVMNTTHSTEKLELFRQQIDSLDEELLDVLSRRMEVSRCIGEYKRDHGMSVIQTERFNDILQSRVLQGGDLGMSPDFLRNMLLAIHEESVRQQLDILRHSQS